MAQQLPNKDGVNLSPSRYTEQRSPQFVGGSIDPESGNVISSSRSQAAIAPPAAAADTPLPAASTTRLGEVSAMPDMPALPKSNGMESALGSAAISAGAGALGKAAGGLFSSPSKDVGNNNGNPLDNPFSGASGRDSGSTSGSSSVLPSSGSQSVDESGFSSAFSTPSIPAYSEPSYSPAAYSPPPAAPTYASNNGGYDSGGGGGDDGGSGSVICSELNRQGLLSGDTFAADQAFGARTIAYSPHVYQGYLAWARHVVPLMKRSARFTRFVSWFAAPWAQYMAIRMGRNGYPSLRGVVLFHAGWFVCAAIGAVMSLRRDRTARA